MQTLPALLPTRPSPHHLRWVDRLPIGSLRSTAIRLAQSVALSATASLIVVVAQHRITGSTVAPSPTEATKQSVVVAEAAVPRQPERPASAAEIAAMKAPVAEDPASGPSGQPHGVSAGRDAGRTRPAETWVPLPPQPPVRAAAGHGVVALAAPARRAVMPEPASSGPMVAPRLVRTAIAVPLPPRRAMLAEARVPMTQALQTVASPIRIAAGASVTAGKPIVLAAVTAPAAPASALHLSGGAQILVAPVRYGMGLALGVGEFAMATNDRLISGTTDAIGSLVR